MNLSAILVFSQPHAFERCRASLDALPDVEVHHLDPDRSRMIIIQEAADVSSEVDGLRRIQALPDVIAADLIYHWFGEDPNMILPQSSILPN